PIQPLAGRPNTLIHPNLEGAARVAEGLPVVPDVDPQGSSDEDNDESHTDTDESENPPPATHSALAPAPPVTSARERDDASNIQQLGQYLRLPDIQIENVQRTASLMGQDHWTATLMYLEWIRYRLELSGSIGPMEVGPVPQVTRQFAFHPDVQTFICRKIREALLMANLQACGRTQTVRNRTLIPRSPVVLVKASIDAMEAEWKAMYMPPGYLTPENDAVTLVRNLIRELLKYEKSSLAKL
ncbi:hypothetical protein PTTG_10545, partial [Puccinia triticina 1-1 BBBD Race 1]